MKGITPSSEPFAETRYLDYTWDRESIMAKAPEASGIYGLYHGIWIRVGESDNIRASLLELLEQNDPCVVRHEPSGFAFEAVVMPARHHRYMEVLKETEPICGRKTVGLRPRRYGSLTGGTPSDEIGSKRVTDSFGSSVAVALKADISEAKSGR